MKQGKKGKLKKAERLEIKILLDKRYGINEIARTMHRSNSTISDEVKRGGGKEHYDSHKAHHNAYVKRWRANKDWKKIEKNRDLKKYIIQRLKKHWNPREIAGRMREEKQPFYASKTAIYEWLRTSRGDRYCDVLYSGRHYVKKHKKRIKRVLILERVGIEKRPHGATNRTRYGHWELDAVVSGRSGVGGIEVASERKSKYVDAAIFSSYTLEEMVPIHRKLIANKKALTVTYDNGIENRGHQQLGIPTYFCNPYSSWEKGGVENANKMLRRYFPKGTDFSKVTMQELQKALDLINGKPRASLGFRTATEVAIKHGIIGVSK